MPTLILERVHNGAGISTWHAAARASRADVRRQQLAPRARRRPVPRIKWMAAAIAPGAWELYRERPASSAHEVGLRGHASASTNRADWREQQVDERRTQVASDTAQPDQAIAFHITFLSGSKPNQRANAMAPCSTSMPSPSAARCPALRASVTQAVSPGA